MGISTRTGDSGFTSILAGNIVKKDDPVIEVLGVCDELICRLGVAKLYIDMFKVTIDRFQKKVFQLYDIFSNLGRSEDVGLEKEIHFLDMLTEEYSQDIGISTKKPAVPDVTKASINLQLARVACRTLERRVVGLKDNIKLDNNIIKYINRLSDVLYLMAIIAEKQSEDGEI